LERDLAARTVAAAVAPAERGELSLGRAQSPLGSRPLSLELLLLASEQARGGVARRAGLLERKRLGCRRSAVRLHEVSLATARELRMRPLEERILAREDLTNARAT
jgi:hypothetical protein